MATTSTRTADLVGKLQVNNSGAWKTISMFDPRDAAAKKLVSQAVTALCRVNPTFSWRLDLGDQVEYWERENGIWRAR